MGVRLVRNRSTPAAVTIRTATARAFVRARLNGRPIWRLLEPGRLGRRDINLTTLHGLRFGLNRVVVVAHDGSRRGDRDVRTFRIRRTKPLASAQVPRVASVSGTALLDAGPSRAAHGGRLSYRWTLLRRPRGSRARLRRAGRRVASIRPDRPGRYRLRLRVLEARRGARPAQTGFVPGDYVFDVDGQAVIPAYGLELQTTTTGGAPGVTLAGTGYPPPGSPGQGYVQGVVIDRATGAVVQNAVVPGNGSRDLEDLILALDPLEPGSPWTAAEGFGYMLVVTAPQASPPDEPISEDTIDDIDSKMLALGVSDAGPGARNIALGEPFTFVGVPGMVAGQGTANFDGTAANAGGLTAYLRLSALSTTGPVLRLEQPDTVPFAINDIADAGSLGDTPIPAPPAGGMGVTVLDAHSLGAFDQASVSTGTSLAGMASFLNQYVQDPSKLVVVRINNLQVSPDDLGNAYQVVNALAALGANRDLLVQTLCSGGLPTPCAGPTPPYTLIGGAAVQGRDGTTLKTTQGTGGAPVAVSDDNLQGFLVRDAYDRFQPQSTSFPAYDGALKALAAATPQPFGYPSSPPDSQPAGAYAAAEGDMYDLLVQRNVLCTPGTLNCVAFPRGIRINYGNPSFAPVVTQGAVATSLGCSPTYQGAPAPLDVPQGAPYDQDQLDALQVQICAELYQYQQVASNTFMPLSTILLQSEVQNSTNLFGEGFTFLGFINQKAALSARDPLALSSDFISLLGDAVTGVSALFESPVGEAVGAGITGVANTLTTVDNFLRSDTGDAENGYIETTVGGLANTLQDRYTNDADAMTELQALIVSDPTKLATAFGNSAAGADWYFGDNDSLDPVKSQSATVALKMLSQQWSWPQLIASAASPSCSISIEGWPQPRSNPMQYNAAVTLDQAFDTNTNQWVVIVDAGNMSSVSLSSTDSQALASQLFDNAFDGVTDLSDAPSGASIVKSDFFLKQLFPQNNGCTAPNPG